MVIPVVVVQLQVMSDSLWPHGLQHARLLCPSPSPRVCSNSCPLSQWCHLTISSFVTLLSFFPSIFPNIREFSNESDLHTRWPKYWRFSFSISPSSECSRLISLRIDWFDLLAIQGTLKSLLQHHSSKASVLQHSGFIMVQLSHPYMTTEKTIPLTIRTFVGKIRSLFLHGSFQARIQEWVAISFSRGSSPPMDGTWVSCTAGRLFTVWPTREAQWELSVC